MKTHRSITFASLLVALLLAISIPATAFAGNGDTYVWKTATGKKYHATDHCGGTNPATAKRITLQMAIERYGLEACQNCYAPIYDPSTPAPVTSQAATTATPAPTATATPAVLAAETPAATLADATLATDAPTVIAPAPAADRPAAEYLRDATAALDDAKLGDDTADTCETTRKTHLYAKPDVDSKQILSIPQGTTLTIEQSTKYFYKVTFQDKTGYVRIRHAEAM